MQNLCDRTSTTGGEVRTQKLPLLRVGFHIYRMHATAASRTEPGWNYKVHACGGGVATARQQQPSGVAIATGRSEHLTSFQRDVHMPAGTVVTGDSIPSIQPATAH
jgi:hypothetical protein